MYYISYKTFYLLKVYNIFSTQSTNSNSFKGHEFHYIFVVRQKKCLQISSDKTTHFIPNTKKPFHYTFHTHNISLHILSSYIPLTFTYPIQKKLFHYTFKGHELHTHFITIHSKGMNFTTHFVPNTKKKKPKTL